jgi:hypothetical protein
MLIAIAMVHIDNGRTIVITMGLFASGVAVSFLLILAHDRPFIGELSISPTPLIQVETAAPLRQKTPYALSVSMSQPEP